MQKIHTVIFSFSLLLFSASPVFAKLTINEFSSNGSSDWLEIHNDGSEPVDLSIYRIRDSSATNKLDLTGAIDAGGFVSFDFGDKLNNGGDIIKLVFISDETNIVDQVAYGSAGEDIGVPSVGQSAGRQLNNGSWVLFSSPSKGSSNTSSQLVPTPTVTIAPTLTPTKIPTPTKTPSPTKSPTPIKSVLATTKTPTLAKNEPTKAVKLATVEAVVTGKKAAVANTLQADSVTGSQPTPVSGKENKTEVKSVSVIGREKDIVLIATSIGSFCLIACAILLYWKGRIHNSHA